MSRAAKIALATATLCVATLIVVVNTPEIRHLASHLLFGSCARNDTRSAMLAEMMDNVGAIVTAEKIQKQNTGAYIDAASADIQNKLGITFGSSQWKYDITGASRTGFTVTVTCLVARRGLKANGTATLNYLDTNAPDFSESTLWTGLHE